MILLLYNSNIQIKASSVQSVQFSSVVQSCPTLRPHEPQHARPPCPSPTPGVYSNSYPSSWWCHPTISSSVAPFSSCLQSFPASGSFAMSQLFASGGQRIGVSTSTAVLPMNVQDWVPLGGTGWISLQSWQWKKNVDLIYKVYIAKDHGCWTQQLHYFCISFKMQRMVGKERQANFIK